MGKEIQSDSESTESNKKVKDLAPDSSGDSMDSRMLEEYKFLRQELETNRKFVFERPLLIVGVTLTLSAAMKESLTGLSWFLPILLLTVLVFNLWFTFNRLWSSSRIVAYIQLVHEGGKKLPWIGWENALHEFRRMAYRMNKQGQNLLKRTPDTYHSMGYYAPIFYFHLVIGLGAMILVILPNNGLGAVELVGSARMHPIYLYTNVISLVVFLLAFVLFRPAKVRYAIEQNRNIWKSVLHHRLLATLLIPLSSVKNDPAMKSGRRGERKIVVTDIDLANETETTNIQWEPPHEGEKAQVQTVPDMELAFFNQIATQDRHYHEIATEIYIVVEGTMVICVEKIDFTLSSGDMIIVNPNTPHQVKTTGIGFICGVVSINCGGASDKYIA